MAKKSFKATPRAKQPRSEQARAFTKGRAETGLDKEEPTRRVSIDIPESLHTRFKVACAKTRNKMAPEIVAFIEKRVLELENETT